MSGPHRSRHIVKTARKARLQQEVRRLARSLNTINSYDYRDVASNEGSAQRRAAIDALEAITGFLRSQGIASFPVFQIVYALRATEFLNRVPAIFAPARGAGRKPATQFAQALKGWFAGMAYAQMQSGMKREQAASWVARKIPSTLSCQLSGKPIRSSTIKEWMDHYGCNARLRHEAKSLWTSEELLNKYRSQQKHINPGEFYCLMTIGIGHEHLAGGMPIPFEDIFAELQNEYAPQIFQKVQTEFWAERMAQDVRW